MNELKTPEMTLSRHMPFLMPIFVIAYPIDHLLFIIAFAHKLCLKFALQRYALSVAVFTTSSKYF